MGIVPPILVGEQTSSITAVFVDSNKKQYQVQVGSPIPIPLKPFVPDPNVVYGYSLKNGILYYYSSTDGAPIQSIFKGVWNLKSTNLLTPQQQEVQVANQTAIATPPPNLSDGGIYASPTGVEIQIPIKIPVPDGYISVPVVTSNINQLTAGLTQSTGGIYTDTDTGVSVQIPQFVNVPSNYVPADSLASGTAALQAEADKLNPPVVGSGIASIVGKILLAVGVVGVSYIGYLFITDPGKVRKYVEEFDSLKTLAVDASQMLIAIVIVVGISFVSYEFWQAYENTGTFGGAIGELTADVIETLVGAVVTATETLASDAWEAIKSGLKEILPNWL
jgi:hypothetical protein